MGKGAVIEDLHSLLQDNQYAFIILPHCKTSEAARQKGRSCRGMDRRTGLQHSDGLPINSPCMGFISSCTRAMLFTVSAAHPLPGEHTSPPWVLCCCCPPAHVLCECPFPAPPGRAPSHRCAIPSCGGVVPLPCCCDSGPLATCTHTLWHTEGTATHRRSQAWPLPHLFACTVTAKLPPPLPSKFS